MVLRIRTCAMGYIDSRGPHSYGQVGYDSTENAEDGERQDEISLDANLKMRQCSGRSDDHDDAGVSWFWCVFLKVKGLVNINGKSVRDNWIYDTNGKATTTEQNNY